MKRQKGFSLSELLIALFLASLMTSLVIQVYLLNKKHYLKLQEELHAHFEVQWAQDLLAESIRRAGFTPCLNIESLHLVDRRGGRHAFHGQKLIIKPQALEVNRMAEDFAILKQIVDERTLLVSSTDLEPGQSLLIADCQQAELHELSQKKKLAHGVLLSLTKPLAFHYSASTYVGSWLEECWFIRNNKEGLAALYYQLGRAEELSSQIHSMRIKSELFEGKTQLDLVWGLDKQLSHHFTVLVRT